MFKDKKNILTALQTGEIQSPVLIELGCGPRKLNPNAIGIDMLDYDGVDIVGNALEVLAKIPPGSVDRISSHHFVEHLPDVRAFLELVGKVLKPGGKMEVVVPHFSNPYYYSDPTHKTFFGLYTFCYMAQEELFSRKVYTYQLEINFRIESVNLIFKSTRPFYIRHAIKKLFGLIFNSNYWLKEFYEENFANLIPCYEVKYVLVRL